MKEWQIHKCQENCLSCRLIAETHAMQCVTWSSVRNIWSGRPIIRQVKQSRDDIEEAATAEMIHTVYYTGFHCGDDTHCVLYRLLLQRSYTLCVYYTGCHGRLHSKPTRGWLRLTHSTSPPSTSTPSNSPSFSILCLRDDHLDQTR